MPYPMILCVGDECLARVTVDGLFSVRWDRVLQHAYEPPDGENRAVIGFCRLLLAARDNFVTCVWDDPQAEAEAAAYYGHTAEIYSTPLVSNQPVFTLYVGPPLARINWDLTWSVHWTAIEHLKLIDDDILSFNPAVSGLINLLLAAKDNFICTPWY